MTTDQLAQIRERAKASRQMLLNDHVDYVPTPSERDRAFLLTLVDQQQAEIERLNASVCQECGGLGVVDSGGATPWGSAINIPCPSCEISRQRESIGKRWQEDSSLEKWFPHTSETIKQQQAEIERYVCRECGGSGVFKSAGIAPDGTIFDVPCKNCEVKRECMRIGTEWHKDSSLEKWFPFDAEKIKKLEAEITRLKAALEVYQREAGKMMVMREFFKTFPGVGSLLKSAHQHPEHDPDCTYCVLIDSAEKAALAQIKEAKEPEKKEEA